MKLKIFIDHDLSDKETLLSDLVRVQTYFKGNRVKDFLATEIDNNIHFSETYNLIQEAIEDYKNKYIDGRISKKLEPIEDVVQIYVLETKQYFKPI